MIFIKYIKGFIPDLILGLLRKLRSYLNGLFILKDYLFFKKKSISFDKRFSLSYDDLWPCLFDKTQETNFERHYVYHLAWAARCVKEISPTRHTDIGSRLFFPTILSAFIPTDFYDYRPADIILSNMGSFKADLKKLPFDDNKLESVSCLHTIEHIGLGRYGDEIDPKGDLKAINELSRVVAKNGSLLIVVPVGEKMKIQFNAHRIYTYGSIISYFPDFELKDFSYIPDESKSEAIINNADPKEIKNDVMGCGCFWFIKK